MGKLKAPFPYFGGKRTVAADVWARFGAVKQYIEPFCGSAAILLAAPKPAILEVVNDLNGYIANFWRAVKHQPAAVAEAADYPVSHVGLGARLLSLQRQGKIEKRDVVKRKVHGGAHVVGAWRLVE